MQNSVMSWNLAIKLSWWQTIRDIPDFNYVMPLIWNWTGYLLDSQCGKFALLVELYDSLQVWSFFCCVSNWNDTTLRFFFKNNFLSTHVTTKPHANWYLQSKENLPAQKTYIFNMDKGQQQFMFVRAKKNVMRIKSPIRNTLALSVSC